MPGTHKCAINKGALIIKMYQLTNRVYHLELDLARQRERIDELERRIEEHLEEL